MATASPKLPRKLSEKIDGRDVYVADIVNDDLEQLEELNDVNAELQRSKDDLERDIDECDNAEERKELRARAREVSREQRTVGVQMLGIYVEDKDGERFAEETLAATPVRVQTVLLTEATKKIYGDAGPTPGMSVSG